MRHGITIQLESFHNRHILELARHAERLGYSDAWSAESFGFDGFSPIAAAAAVTEKIRFGTAIIPVFTRPAALIAMSAATVQSICNGRLILGLGISTPTIVEKWMGIKYERPVTRLKETVVALRAALAGDKVSVDGKTIKIDGFRLDVPKATPPPIFLAAQGAQMLRLAGEIGDGLITNFVSPEMVPAMLEHYHAGARLAGKDPSKMEVVCRIVAIVDEDTESILNDMRRSLTAYLTVPQYNSFFRQFGFENVAESALEAWKAGDRKKALSAVPDEMLKSIYMIGSADYCRERLKQYEAAGITTTALLFTSFAATPEARRAKVMQAMENLAPR